MDVYSCVEKYGEDDSKYEGIITCEGHNATRFPKGALYRLAMKVSKFNPEYIH